MRPDKLKKFLGAAAVMAGVAIPLNLYAGVEIKVEIEGIAYQLTSDNEAHVIARSHLTGSYFPEDYNLIIPQSVEYQGETYTVTELKDVTEHGYSFGALTNEPIATLSLPSTIKEIGSLPESNLPRLTSITVDPENKRYRSVDGVLYSIREDGSLEELLKYPQCKPGSIFDIPEGVTELHSLAFHSSMVNHINFPSSLTHIGPSFQWVHLDEIVLHEGITRLDEQAFEYVTCHAPLLIPESVKTIGRGCFWNTEGFSRVIFPSHVTEIGEEWFRSVDTDTIHIQPQIKKICYLAFAGSKIRHFDLPYGIHTIEACAFAFCDSLREIKLPVELTILENRVFWECENLERVTMHNKIMTVKAAFEDCPALSDLYVYCVTPPELDEECPLGYRDPEYFINRLGQITVHVLEGCGEAYRNSTWAKVGPIVEDLSSEVEDLPADGAISSTETCTAYTLQGTVAAEGIPYGELREALSPGIYIIRTASGKTEKIRLESI